MLRHWLWRSSRTLSLTPEPKENKQTRLTDKEMFDPLPIEVADAFNMALNQNARPGDDFVPSGHGGSHPYLVHEFVSAVAERRMPKVSAWDAAM